MTCSLEYRNIYNNIRNKLLIVNLANTGLTDADKEFLVSKSEMMKTGLGLSENDSKTLSRILVKAFHSDLNKEEKDNDNVRDAITILDDIKALIKSGEIKKFEGQRVSPVISLDLAECWKTNIIKKIGEKITSSSNPLNRQINEIATEYINMIGNSTSLSQVNSLFSTFSNKYNSLLSNYKDKFFAENEISSALDFKITPDISLDDLYAKLHTIKMNKFKNTTESIERLISEYRSKVDDRLKPLISEIGRYYMDQLKKGNITIENISLILATGFNEVKKNEKIYIDRINRCNVLNEMSHNISSLRIKTKLEELSQSFYYNESFTDEISKLEEDIRSIKEEKFADRILENVRSNYIKALSKANNGIEDNIEMSNMYTEFLHKLEEYNNRQIGIDSLYELNDLFKDRKKDKEIISYVKGNYNEGDKVNLDLVMLKVNEYGGYGLTYRQDSEFYGQRYYKNIGISGLALIDENNERGLTDLCTLTEFICNANIDGSQYFNRDDYFNILCTLDDTCLAYNKDGNISFKNKEAIYSKYEKGIYTPSKQYSNINWIVEAVSKDVSKDLSLAKLLNNNYQSDETIKPFSGGKK